MVQVVSASADVLKVSAEANTRHDHVPDEQIARNAETKGAADPNSVAESGAQEQESSADSKVDESDAEQVNSSLKDKGMNANALNEELTTVVRSKSTNEDPDEAGDYDAGKAERDHSGEISIKIDAAADADRDAVDADSVDNEGSASGVHGRHVTNAESVSKEGAAKSSKLTGRSNTDAVQKRPKPSSGVVYVSRIPPGMDVGALRSLLGRAGRLGRVWLRPESAEARKERRALGSSRRRGEFRDGWVEFPKRRDAKRAVVLLNGRPMAGATRRGRWADDLWCLKLLRGYQWSDLIEETCSGARERTLRVKAEVAAARREKAFVEERVAMARQIEKDEGEKKAVRHFRQKRSIADREWEEDVDERRAREAMKRVDEELETGKARPIDQELVGMLFKKRRTNDAVGKASR